MYSSNCYSKPSYYMSFDGDNWTTVTPSNTSKSIPVYHEHDIPSHWHTHEQPNYWQEEQPKLQRHQSRKNNYWQEESPHKNNWQEPAQRKKKNKKCHCCCKQNISPVPQSSQVPQSSPINISSNTYEVLSAAIEQCLSYCSDNAAKNHKLAEAICDYFDIVKPKTTDVSQQLIDLFNKYNASLSSPTNDQLSKAINDIFGKPEMVSNISTLLSSVNVQAPKIVSPVSQTVPPTAPPSTPISIPTTPNTTANTTQKKQESFVLSDKSKTELANSVLNLFEESVNANGNESTKKMYSLFRNILNENIAPPKETPIISPIPTPTPQSNVLDNVLEDYISRTSSIIDSMNEEED